MSSVYRSNRKATDEQIIRLNSVGLSLATIAKLIDCHPTTVTIRLRSLNIEPADTRRTFMEDIVKTMTEGQMEWLADQLGPHISVKDFVRNLLVKEYLTKNQGNQSESTASTQQDLRKLHPAGHGNVVSEGTP